MAARSIARRRVSRRETPVRYAVVGLGYIAQTAVLPAFAHARRNSRLAALVSDDPAKLRRLSRRYRVEKTYSYEEYGACLESGDIDAVYIALPNFLHRTYAVAAARAGIHVLCEKPLAVTEEECEDIVLAAEEAGVRLMTAYRLHFEQANLEAVRVARSGRIGEPRLFQSMFTMQVEKGNIRLEPEGKGGGPFYDIGVYCINAARYLFRAEPNEVFAVRATSDEKRFGDVAETASAILRFPGDRLAAFTCSFGAADAGWYQLVGTRGDLRLDPAYEYAKPLRHVLTVDGRSRQRTFAKRDQFAAELLAFSDGVVRGRDPEPSGREGLADVRVIRALLRSADTGRPVTLSPFERSRRPGPAQAIRRPAVPREPELVHAQAPSAG
ncbi:MAG TPA: Gfo/Idh/MocA family oxidoreductase [Thermoanaerobaculia bacterium]